MAGNKTFVACRPGMLQAMQKAFDGIDVVVDDKLQVDYEFRERELTEIEALEAELDKAEKFEADPKDAATFIVPLVTEDVADDFGAEFNFGADVNWHAFAAVRCERYVSDARIREVISTVTPIISDDEVNGIATAGAIRAALKKEEINVYSVSVANGLTWLKHS